jgi:hypothetical protein
MRVEIVYKALRGRLRNL